MTTRPVVLAVEDELSASVMCKLLSTRNGLTVNRVINARGCGPLKAGIEKYKAASMALPHLILTDLDRYPCPVALLTDWNAIMLPPTCGHPEKPRSAPSR